MNHPHASRWTRSFRNRSAKRQQLRLRLEQLESRYLLAGDTATPPPITWFESYDEVPRVSYESLADVDPVYPAGFQGPRELAAGEWIIQLEESTARRIRVLASADESIDDGFNEFTIIAGLGSKGLMLVRGEGVTAADIEASLSGNDSVESFSRNSVITGQEITINDFSASLMQGLDTINVQAAWEQNTGSMNTVVGVVDSGIDLDHPDLYLNIWINQGEIPAEIREGDPDVSGDELEDIDKDGLITFYDLNNLHVIDGVIYVHSSITWDNDGNFVSGDLATEDQLTRETPWAVGPNGVFVTDLPGEGGRINGRIDAFDLLRDRPRWSDGRDTDRNGFFDDLFGVNFRSGSDDPLAINEPDDPLGHGTHVAGTIGAVGNNHTGVVGVNWQTSLMSLRILDNNNRSDAGAGLRAVNYAKMMRERHEIAPSGRTTEGANVRVLNNSWGQPGGYESAFETAIGELGEAGVLFVAAAGNGDIFGNGVNNDVTPFYPASYDAPNIISVAASTINDRLATFSNYGASSVDIAAPGVGILSTTKGGGTGTANGTSMAAPHVSGTAALIWSELPQSTVAEIKSAILSDTSVTSIAGGQAQLSTGGRLDAFAALNAEVFAPTATLKEWNDITESGDTFTEFTVEYWHRDGIDASSLGSDDLLVHRTWGPREPIPVTFIEGSEEPTEDGKGYTARYRMDAPGGGTFTNDTVIPIDAAEPNTIRSQIYVSDVSQLVADFTVTLDLEHTYTSDLTATLVAPNGQSAELFRWVGGDGDDFQNTVFDDRASTWITSVPAPFAGTFKPEQSILALGESGPNGVWTLVIDDDAQQDGGQLNSWALDFNGSWDEIDYGRYMVQTGPLPVKSSTERSASTGQVAGAFNVKIAANDINNLHYVNSFRDDGSPDSLRASIIRANQSTDTHTIILDAGTYQIEVDETQSGILDDESVGDLDAIGSLRVFGASAENTIIDGQYLSRVFHVHSNGSLELRDVSVVHGFATDENGGGGVLNEGLFNANGVKISHNVSQGPSTESPSRGGGIASLGSGAITIEKSWLHGNRSDFGGAVYLGGNSGGTIERSTISQNIGGGIHSHSDADWSLQNSTLATNIGGLGAIFDGKRDGRDVGNESSHRPSLSANGRYIAFQSDASNLVDNDTNEKTDIFVYDSWSESIERVSLSAFGVEGNGDSTNPAISGDGRYVAFETLATNLVEAGNSPVDDPTLKRVVVYDRNYGLIDEISVSTLNVERANGTSFSPTISADGRYVAFGSVANNLHPDDTNDHSDIFIRDRLFQSTDWAIVQDSGYEVTRSIGSPTISDDGRYVAFARTTVTIPPGYSGILFPETDIYLFDRVVRNISTKVNRVVSEPPGIHASTSPSISSDGRYIAFASDLPNLVNGDTNESTDIFVADRTRIGSSNAISLVSRDRFGGPSNGSSFEPRISADGNSIAFRSRASDLIAGSSQQRTDVFIVNRSTGNVQRASDSPEQNGVFAFAYETAISDDGRFVAFASSTPGIVGSNSGETAHVYVFNKDSENVYSPTFLPKQNQVSVSQSTIVGTGNAKYSVRGNVNLTDVLLANDGLEIDPQVSLDNVLRSSTRGSGLLGPLYRFKNLPPVFPLLNGNPAIDTGSGKFVGTYDQNGTQRLSPDVGAVEVVSATVSGKVFGDVDNDGVASPSEVGFADVELSVISSLGFPAAVASSKSLSDGSFSFENLPPGPYALEAELDESWSLSRDAFEKLPSVDDDVSINANGTVVAFSSFSDSLATPDNLGHRDIFLFDRGTGETNRASTGLGKVEANGDSASPSISADGRFVVFQSTASNLTSISTNSQDSIFLYDRKLDDIQLVNQPLSGVLDGHSFDASISGNGRFIAFVSHATNLVQDDTNRTCNSLVCEGNDVFVYDRLGEFPIERVNLRNDGQEAESGRSWSPSISFDGRFVAFESRAENLVNDGNGKADIFVYDRDLDVIERVSVTSSQTEADGDSFSPTISGDGRYVAFYSDATNLSPAGVDANLFVFDRETDQLRPVGKTNSTLLAPSLSFDGRFLVLSSRDDSLANGDMNDNVADILVFDQESSGFHLVSRGLDGQPADDSSGNPIISSDGRAIVFDSRASNLVPFDQVNQWEKFATVSPGALKPATDGRFKTSQLIPIHAIEASYSWFSAADPVGALAGFEPLADFFEPVGALASFELDARSFSR